MSEARDPLEADLSALRPHELSQTDLWTVGRLRQVIREHSGMTVSHDTVWRRLRDVGFTYQKPERRNFEGHKIRDHFRLLLWRD